MKNKLFLFVFSVVAALFAAGPSHGQVTLKFSEFTPETSPLGTDFVAGYRSAGIAGGNRKFSLSVLNTYFSSNIAGITNSQITSLAFSKLTTTPTTLAGYGIADSLTASAAAAAYQPLDTDLTAWALVNPSAYSNTSAIAAGYQPLDSDLTAIAAVTTTSTGRSLLAAADGAAIRTIAGAGTSNFDGVFASLTSKPTTLAGYGIADGITAAALVAVNGSGVNVGGKVDWSQLMNVPAGFADGTDDGAGGGSGDFSSNTSSSVDGEMVLFSGTGGKTGKRSTLNGGLLKSTAGVPSIATAGTDYEVPLTFSTGLTRTTNTITVNTSQNIATLSNLTSNGFVKTSGGTGALSIDTTSYQTLDAALTAIAAGSDFVQFTGPSSSTKIFTLPNATSTILTDNAAVTVAQGGSGRTTGTTAYGLIAAGTTATGAQQTLAAGATTEILVGGGAAALPIWTTAQGSGAPVRATSPTITTPTIAKLANLTTNGFVKTSSSDGTLSVDTATYIPTTGVGLPVVIQVAASDASTAITAGNGKVTFRMPWAGTLTAVRGSVTTAPTGSTIIFDLNKNGTTVLSTKLSIDASEKTTTTAASAAVISVSSFADDDEVSVDFDQVGSTVSGAGAIISFYFTRT